jgi:glycosyltransferase involved in cell wall biosynthesis
MAWKMSAIPAAPAIAVIIPTHNRAESLARLITSVLAQTVPCEIYVMDDASTDGTEQMIRRDFPQVQFHRQQSSRGPTFQRNDGVKLSHAPFIFTLDDDCALPSSDTFRQTIEAFDHPRIGAVTLPFTNVLGNKQTLTQAKKDGQLHLTFDYFGGMIAFRREAYVEAGGYRDYLFMHVEEFDLSIRLLQHGYVIRLGWADPIEHWESPVRDMRRIKMLEARNHVLYCFYNVPWPYFPAYLFVTTLNNLKLGLQRKALVPAIQGLLRGYAGIFHEFFRRKPVSGDTYRLSRLMKSRHEVSLEEIESLLPRK